MKQIAITILFSLCLTSCLMFGHGTKIPTVNGYCPNSHPIKGNMDSYIYHTYDSPYYRKTQAEICFETPAQARKAGFRQSSKH